MKYISVKDIGKVSDPTKDHDVKMLDLVRCDECRWCKVDGGFRRCMMSAIMHPTADDYCSLGERKDAKIN